MLPVLTLPPQQLSVQALGVQIMVYHRKGGEGGNGL